MNAINNNEQHVIPSLRSKEHLEALSQEFTPTDVKFLLALNTSFSEEECIASADKMINDLKLFSESNYDASVGEQLGLKTL